MASKIPLTESARSLLFEFRDSDSIENTGWRQCKDLYKSEKHVSSPRIRKTLVALVVSLFINAGLIMFTLWGNPGLQNSCMDCNKSGSNLTTLNAEHANAQASEFAGLVRNMPQQWTYNTVTDEDWVNLWNSTRFYAGIISLSDTYAREKGLPRAQRWPWDPSRGLYLINGFHNLHCLSFIKTSLDESREGRPQSVPWVNLQHCILSLREDIMCNADDTPRYTGFQRPGNSGYGQKHMCRNWTQLEKWGLELEQESCWRNPEGILGETEGETEAQRMDRFRFCSDGSPYKEIASATGRHHSGSEE